MAQEITDWSELQHDLLVIIAKRLNLIEDYLNFGTVCKSWYSAATKQNFNSELPRVPWLMLAEELEEDDKVSCCRKFFSLYNGMILNKRIPKASGTRCMESMGWLITVALDGEISLLHPFSGVQIELPHQNTTEDYEEHETSSPITFIRKAVLSASPSSTSDFVLMVIEGGIRFLSFWKPGDFRWTRISFASHIPHVDVVYFNGLFYAVDYLGRVRVCDISGEGPITSQIIAQLPSNPRDLREQLYILESLGSLYVVVRDGVHVRRARDDLVEMRIPLTNIPQEGSDNYKLKYGTANFRVFHVDLVNGEVTQTKELGDTAFFLGANASLSVQTSQFPGIKPNHIYFTDDFFESHQCFEEGGGMDMGVFNLANGNIQPQYEGGSIQLHYEGVSLSCVCPPTWVTPTLF